MAYSARKENRIPGGDDLVSISGRSASLIRSDRLGNGALSQVQPRSKGDLMTPTIHSQTLQPSSAFRIGTRIEKINSNHGDSHANGAHGTITSSLRPEMWHGRMTRGYLVVWDDCAAHVFVMDNRIRKMEKE
jgi:hypothetical protein